MKEFVTMVARYENHFRHALLDATASVLAPSF